MSTVPGVFSETDLLEIMIKAEALGLDEKTKLQYKPNIEVLKALQTIQTAKLQPLEDSEKDREMSVYWINTFGIVDEADLEDCEFGTNKASTNKKDYALDIKRKSDFKVSESDLISNIVDWQEIVAKAFLRADKQLAEYLALQAVANLNAFAGPNELGTNGKGVVSGNETYIAPAYWDAKLMSYFERVAIANDFVNPILISGQNLYEPFRNAQFDAGNADGKGDANRFGSMKVYFDLRNIDSVNENQVTYMVDMGSIAMAWKTYYNSFISYKDEDRYKMMSNAFTSLAYDVHYKNNCGTNERVDHLFKLKMRAGIFNNPAGGSTEENTGVLKFVCGTPS